MSHAHNHNGEMRVGMRNVSSCSRSFRGCGFLASRTELQYLFSYKLLWSLLLVHSRYERCPESSLLANHNPVAKRSDGIRSYFVDLLVFLLTFSAPLSVERPY